MRNIVLAAAFAACLIVPDAARADPNAAGGALTGAAIGAGAGLLVGGPIGAAVGAGVGGIVGAGVSQPHPGQPVVIERQPAATTGSANVRERMCTRDSAGKVECTDVRR